MREELGFQSVSGGLQEQGHTHDGELCAHVLEKLVHEPHVLLLEPHELVQEKHELEQEKHGLEQAPHGFVEEKRELAPGRRGLEVERCECYESELLQCFRHQQTLPDSLPLVLGQGLEGFSL